MKRLLSLLLSMILCAALLCSCAVPESSDSDHSASADATTDTVTDQSSQIASSDATDTVTDQSSVFSETDTSATDSVIDVTSTSSETDVTDSVTDTSSATDSVTEPEPEVLGPYEFPIDGPVSEGDVITGYVVAVQGETRSMRGVFLVDDRYVESVGAKAVNLRVSYLAELYLTEGMHIAVEVGQVDDSEPVLRIVAATVWGVPREGGLYDTYRPRGYIPELLEYYYREDYAGFTDGVYNQPILYTHGGKDDGDLGIYRVIKIEDGIVHLAGFSPFYDPHEIIFYFILGDFKELSKLSPGDHVKFSASAYHGTDSCELIYGKDLKTFRILSESEVKKLYR